MSKTSKHSRGRSSTTQTLLTVGRISLLTYMILSFYRGRGAQPEISINNEAIITGIREAQGNCFGLVRIIVLVMKMNL